MDDATPEESKPKGIKPANLTAIIIAAAATPTGRTTRPTPTTRR